jgi:L-iditol 2-dehydrogenase
MVSETSDLAPRLENVGIHIDLEQKLYLSAASPNLEEVLNGSSLKPGEVTISIKSTGICG